MWMLFAYLEGRCLIRSQAPLKLESSKRGPATSELEGLGEGETPWSQGWIWSSVNNNHVYILNS